MNTLSDLMSQKADDLKITPTMTDSTPKRDSASPNIDFDELHTPLSDASTSQEHPQDQKTGIGKHEAEQPVNVDDIKKTLYRMKDELDAVLRLLDGKPPSNALTQPPETSNEELLMTGEKIIEGVFNGTAMIGPDGNEYPVPPNYASKSKLVEGDMMKLTITNSGRFIFKQIGPIDRKHVIGTLSLEPGTGQWIVTAEGRPYKILTASATFYKGQPGDDVTILVPQNGESEWGAVEHIIHQ